MVVQIIKEGIKKKKLRGGEEKEQELERKMSGRIALPSY